MKKKRQKRHGELQEEVNAYRTQKEMDSQTSKKKKIPTRNVGLQVNETKKRELPQSVLQQLETLKEMYTSLTMREDLTPDVQSIVR